MSRAEFCTKACRGNSNLLDRGNARTWNRPPQRAIRISRTDLKATPQPHGNRIFSLLNVGHARRNPEGKRRSGSCKYPSEFVSCDLSETTCRGVRISQNVTGAKERECLDLFTSISAFFPPCRSRFYYQRRFNSAAPQHEKKIRTTLYDRKVARIPQLFTSARAR